MEKLQRLRFSQLLDSALPVGGFSHSFGLETYCNAGKMTSGADLERYLLSQLQSGWAPLDGVAMKGIYEAAANRSDSAEMARLDHILHVQRISRESREGVQKMGKRLLKLGRSLYPWISFRLMDDAVSLHGAPCTFPAVLAWLAVELEVPVDDAVCGYLYISVTAAANSALRLMSIGQTEVQTIIARVLPEICREWDRVKERPSEELSSFSWSQEIFAMRHETLHSRLFMS
ncbi:urease accessory protein UreF [Paenibacillus sp. DYY-L-2]|uniref:urease accessory protein UreF n=1 Tax=Paenibacillus sp. DYY-L-2 TaxID=3447013 RepID=UPI003F4F8A14